MAAKTPRLAVISKNMFEIGNKFAKMTLESDSARSAKQSFEMARRAYELCVNIDKNGTNNMSIDWTMLFISALEGRMERSLAWKLYTAFCESNELMPTQKTSFFNLLEDNGFTFKKSSGLFYITSPKEASRQVEFHRKLLREEPNLLAFQYEGEDGRLQLESPVRRRRGEYQDPVGLRSAVLSENDLDDALTLIELDGPLED